MWGHRPKLDDDETVSETETSEGDGAEQDHERVKSDEDGGFLVSRALGYRGGLERRSGPRGEAAEEMRVAVSLSHSRP